MAGSVGRNAASLPLIGRDTVLRLLLIGRDNLNLWAISDSCISLSSMNGSVLMLFVLDRARDRARWCSFVDLSVWVCAALGLLRSLPIVPLFYPQATMKIA